MIALLLAITGSIQDPLAQVRTDEARRVAVVARCAPAVCSVMAMDEPGGGSGVVIHPHGYVLTNFHVVGAPDKGHRPKEPKLPPLLLQAWRDEHLPLGAAHHKNRKVGLPDGELYEAIVLGIDPGSDLAVLRIVPKRDGQTFPFCRLGDSDRLLVGETVFAMGNPFLLATDFTPTVTFGIVSGTHRYQEGQGQRVMVYPDCIQVDAPVNPGNSGGPLFDESGAIVGINGRISIGDRGRVNVGVGFAIASNQIANFLGDLLAGRHAEHGTLDLSASFMNAPASGDAAAQRGVFVQQMFKDSVAAVAGVGLGDEITRFDGTEIRSANQLATLVGVLPAGAWTTLWHRKRHDDGSFGDERKVTLTLSRLDTGSSRDGVEGRLASRAERRRAAAALVASWAPVEEKVTAVHWQSIAPDGSKVQAFAHGERLRLELPDRVLVLQAPGRAFVRVGEELREPTADEAERLRREVVANPLLWPLAHRAERLHKAMLLGGVHVFGAPALRFELPGDGECEAWFFHDGTPAGCAFRDPLRRARIEWHVRGDQLRVVVDGVLEPAWSASPRRTGPVDEAWFRRDA